MTCGASEPVAGGASVKEVTPMLERIIFVIAALATIGAFVLDVLKHFRDRK